MLFYYSQGKKLVYSNILIRINVSVFTSHHITNYFNNFMTLSCKIMTLFIIFFLKRSTLFLKYSYVFFSIAALFLKSVL